MKLNDTRSMVAEEPGLSRRRALRLLGGGVAGGWLALRGAPVSAKPRCRRPGEECDREKPCCNGVCCNGVCCPPGQVCVDGRCVAAPDLVVCICGDGANLQICADIDCDSSAAQAAICGPACAAHGGESAAGCIPNAAQCTG